MLNEQLAAIDAQIALHKGAILGLEEAKALIQRQAQAAAVVDNAEAKVSEANA